MEERMRAYCKVRDIDTSKSIFKVVELTIKDWFVDEYVEFEFEDWDGLYLAISMSADKIMQSIISLEELLDLHFREHKFKPHKLIDCYVYKR